MSDLLDGLDLNVEDEPDTATRTIFHPAEPGIQISLELVTPTRAVQLLGANHDGQRRVATPTVHKYSADMTDGNWYFVGDPIRIDQEGHLIDGQHRMYGVVESGVAEYFLIVSGLPTGRMLALDAGKRRTFANQLAMLHHQATGEKLKNPQQVAALCTAMYYWEGGNYGCDNMPRVPNPQLNHTQPSHTQLMAIKNQVEAEAEVTFEHAAAAGLAAQHKRPGIYATVYSTLWVLLSRLDKELRERFFFELTCENPDVQISAPMNGLKNRMLRKGKNEVWPKWLQLHFLIATAVAMSLNQEAPSFRSPSIPRWDVLANIGDIPTGAGSEDN